MFPPKSRSSLVLQRQRITDGTATAEALDYSLKRWVALSWFAQDGRLPVGINWIENQIRPIAIGSEQLIVCGLSAHGPAGNACDESDSKRQAQRA